MFLLGDLFKEAIILGFILFYIANLRLQSTIRAIYTNQDAKPKIQQITQALLAIFPPLVLVILVLGSIFLGIATPTESSVFGCIGAIILSIFYRTFSFKMLKQALDESIKTTIVVFAILIGATAFSLVFSYTGADEIVEEFMSNLPGEKW